ncbi:transcription initiation factor TFIID subunit 4-like isoform X1 [Littorina saxatilis]|uniref:transcription initiation factor TFIID subunit 4-like isoform X1 n=1 Tax=Littorina saxatilis TaxID=31220 RepID=UPI0038B4FD1C
MLPKTTPKDKKPKAKSRSKNEDPEQLKLKSGTPKKNKKLKQKAKELQQAEAEEVRQREANLTALRAIGPRKKQKLDEELGLPGSSGPSSLPNGPGTPSNRQSNPVTIPHGTMLMRNEQGQLMIVQTGGPGQPGGTSLHPNIITTTSVPITTSTGMKMQRPVTTTLPRPGGGTIVIQPGGQTRGQTVTLTQPPTPRVISQPTPTMPAPSIAQPQPAAVPELNKMMLENVKKCKSFLSTLLKLAANQPASTVKNVRDLIQGLIDSKVEPENFTHKLQHELKSSPQPYLVPFLKKSLPMLRQSMQLGKMSIEGIRPPPHEVVIATPSSQTTQATIQRPQIMSQQTAVVRPPMSRSKNEDPEQLKLKSGTPKKKKLKQKAKELQQAEAEEVGQREANLTALGAIGPRKKQKLDEELGLPGSSGPSSLPNGPGTPSNRQSMDSLSFETLDSIHEISHEVVVEAGGDQEEVEKVDPVKPMASTSMSQEVGEEEQQEEGDQRTESENGEGLDETPDCEEDKGGEDQESLAGSSTGTTTDSTADPESDEGLVVEFHTPKQKRTDQTTPPGSSLTRKRRASEEGPAISKLAKYMEDANNAEANRKREEERKRKEERRAEKEERKVEKSEQRIQDPHCMWANFLAHQLAEISDPQVEKRLKIQIHKLILDAQEEELNM